MAFEGLKEQLKDRWADISSRVQESPAFNGLREKFESQTPDAQKLILAGAGVFFAAFMLWFPYSYFSDSSTNLGYFETNRELIQGLLRASRTANMPAPLPAPLDSSGIGQRITAVLNQSRLLPEQIGDMQAIPAPVIPAGMIDPMIVQNGMAVQIKKLNVRQIVEIGTALQNIGNGLKLMGVDVVQSQGQTHYYDMIVKVVSFGLPQLGEQGDDDAKGKKGPKRPARARPKTDDEDL